MVKIFAKYGSFFLLVLFAYTGGVASGFFIYSWKFPQKVVKIESVKMKRSPGGVQSIEVLDGVSVDTVDVRRGVFRRIFGRKKER